MACACSTHSKRTTFRQPNTLRAIVDAYIAEYRPREWVPFHAKQPSLQRALEVVASSAVRRRSASEAKRTAHHFELDRPADRDRSGFRWH